MCHSHMLSGYTLSCYHLTIFTTSTIDFLSNDEIYITILCPTFKDKLCVNPSCAKCLLLSNHMFFQNLEQHILIYSLLHIFGLYELFQNCHYLFQYDHSSPLQQKSFPHVVSLKSINPCPPKIFTQWILPILYSLG